MEPAVANSNDNVLVVTVDPAEKLCCSQEIDGRESPSSRSQSKNDRRRALGEDAAPHAFGEYEKTSPTAAARGGRDEEPGVRSTGITRRKRRNRRRGRRRDREGRCEGEQEEGEVEEENRDEDIGEGDRFRFSSTNKRRRSSRPRKLRFRGSATAPVPNSSTTRRDGDVPFRRRGTSRWHDDDDDGEGDDDDDHSSRPREDVGTRKRNVYASLIFASSGDGYVLTNGSRWHCNEILHKSSWMEDIFETLRFMTDARCCKRPMNSEDAQDGGGRGGGEQDDVLNVVIYISDEPSWRRMSQVVKHYRDNLTCSVAFRKVEENYFPSYRNNMEKANHILNLLSGRM